MTNQQDYWMSDEDEGHGWQPSSHDCPFCGNQLSEMYCVDKSCIICLGMINGYYCDNCEWSGDTLDLRAAQRAKEREKANKQGGNDD